MRCLDEGNLNEGQSNVVPLNERTNTKSHVCMSMYMYEVKGNDSFVMVNEVVKDRVLLPIL